jgi:hypothetical protein
LTQLLLLLLLLPADAEVDLHGHVEYEQLPPTCCESAEMVGIAIMLWIPRHPQVLITGHVLALLFPVRDSRTADVLPPLLHSTLH